MADFFPIKPLNDCQGCPDWFTTAPTAPEEAQEDTTTTYVVTRNAEGIACCSGDKGN